MHALKLNRTFDLTGYVQDNLIMGCDYLPRAPTVNPHPDDIRKGIFYHKVFLPVLVCRTVLSVLPLRHIHDFDYYMILINNDLPVHADDGIDAHILFYIEPGNCTTSFYDYADPSGDKAKQLAEGNVIKTEDFVAAPGEAWVLRVSQPHSVTCNVPNSPVRRTAIQLVSPKHNFDDLCNMLREQGFL